MRTHRRHRSPFGLFASVLMAVGFMASCDGCNGAGVGPDPEPPADAALPLDAGGVTPDAAARPDAGGVMADAALPADAATPASDAATFVDAATPPPDAAVTVVDAGSGTPDAAGPQVDLQMSSLAANPSSGVLANGVSTSLVTVTLRDAAGAPLAGWMVTLSAMPATASVDQPVLATNTSGETTGTIHTLEPGVVTVRAHVGAGTLNQSQEVTFVQVPPVITLVTPTVGAGEGMPVTVSGTHLGGATQLAFNGLEQPSFDVLSDTEILTSVPLGATSGPITVTTPGGTATSDAFTILPAPVLTAVLPAGGAGVGLGVTLQGTGLTGTTQVRFNGTDQPAFTVTSDNTITTTVPAGATTGPLSVETPGGSASMAFTVVPTPSITRVLPALGAGVGMDVVVEGTSLDGATQVSFQGVDQPVFTVDSATQLHTTVPVGATSGPLLVTTPGGTASTSFTVVPTPVITGFTPTPGTGVGLPVVIHGSDFTGATSLEFNGTGQAAFTVDSAMQITTTVPSGATSGPLRVSTPGGTAVSMTFTVVPVPTVVGFTPAGGAAEGAQVVITGTAFTTTQGVQFGGSISATFVVDSATQVTAVVPPGALSGSIHVLTLGGEATSTPFKVLPAITSFTPRKAATGATVTITGTSLTGATAVSFGGTAAAAFTVVDATHVTATVGAGSSGAILVTTPDGTASTSGLLAPPVNLGVGDIADVTSADLNGDGMADVLLLSGNNLVVRLGNGNGTFQAGVAYPTGSFPDSIAVGPLAGDTFPDVVVANLAASNVSVFSGSATGALSPGVTYPTAAGPKCVKLAHVDGDGQLDVVVAAGGGKTVSLLLGNAAGGLNAFTSLQAGYISNTANIDWVETGDLNGDGALDILAYDFGNFRLTRLMGNGDGTFQGVLDTGLPSNAVPTLADINGDGRLDVLRWGGAAGVSVSLGNGNGTFAPGADVPTGNPFRMVTADVTGDGVPDLMVNLLPGTGVKVCVGRGNGTFQTPCLTAPISVQRLGLAAADVDGDGTPDILSAGLGAWLVRSTPAGFFHWAD